MRNFAIKLIQIEIKIASNDKLKSRFLLYFSFPDVSLLKLGSNETEMGIPLFNICKKFFSEVWLTHKKIKINQKIILLKYKVWITSMNNFYDLNWMQQTQG